MKTQLTLVLFAFVTCIFLTSCQKENFETQASQTELNLQAQVGHVYPDQQCGASRTGNLTGNNGLPLGTVEVLNSEANIFLVISMNQGYFLESLSANFGTTADIPESNGNMVLEDFMYMANLAEGAEKYTVVYPTTDLPICNDVVVNATVSQRNWFGQTIGTQTCWLGANPIHDGYFYKYCQSVCN